MTETGERVRQRSATGRIEADYLFYPPEEARSLGEDLRRGLSCPVHFQPQGRALYAADASNYRQVPIGVIAPRHRGDVVDALDICRRHDAPIVARGGGTSLAGQTCNAAVVFDFSRFMNRIVDLDPDTRTAKVQPGCILDHLRDAAEEHHLTFGPDPATHDHNTLGGMIGNNSCGVHSVMSGRTSDYVERLTVLTYDGEILDVGPTPDAELRSIVEKGGRRGDLYGKMLAFRDRYGPLIAERFPDIPRRVSGFDNLDQLLAGNSFNVAKALTGTEGTCALVLDAELALVHSPPCRALAVLGFDNIYEAADAVPRILEHRPCGLEGFDGQLYRHIRNGNVNSAGLDYFPDGESWLIVETGGETSSEARDRARSVSDGFRSSAIITEQKKQKQIWEAREASLGATAFVPGEPETWPGWEDSAVPPDRLGDYLRDIRALMHRHGYEAAFYGHFGDGVLHCRVNFDVHTEAGLANYRQFAEEAATLVTSYGGSLSGEHGDGQSRAELLDIMYGPELVEAFREFKAIWDPRGRMNPGKAIDAYPLDSNIRLGPDYRPPELDTWFAYPDDHGSFAHASIRCVGVGKCRRRHVDDEVMCPSYLATNEEKHSTRGRAHLLHEMVRGEVISDGWDSQEVEDALSLCLACKGCRKDCPVGVDVATYKAEFRAHHYRNRRRPRAAWSMGFIHRWARWAQHAPALANLMTRAPLVSAAAKWTGGIDQRRKLPRFAGRSFQSGFKSNGTGDRVMLWPDTFNNYFRPDTAMAAARILESAGYEVVLPRKSLCCGRPLYDWGYLDEAKALWEETFAVLDEAIASGTPIIGLEPACTSAFKDELGNLFPDRDEAKKLAGQVTHISDFIFDNFERFPSPRGGGKALVQPHCHHHAVIGFDSEMELFGKLELQVERPPQGCCGMAGAFGFATETHDVGVEIGERILLPAIRKASSDTIILADGFSCREQIEQGTHRQTLHIVELLQQRMLH